MIKVRNRYELELMRQSGRISAQSLKKVLENIKTGVNISQLEEVASSEIRKLSGKESFKSVDNYFWATCITLNDEVVHGTPNREIILKDGDLVSVDLGAIYRGWHTDCAWSVLVGQQTKDDKKKQKEKFLKVGEEAMWAGVKQAVDGNRVGDISHAIGEVIEGAGYSVVRSLVGHGVGRSLHEEPEIPGVGKKGTGAALKRGMTLAIEAIYTQGQPEVVLDSDGWTIRSKDGSLGGLFEMTVAVEEKMVEVLTDWRKI